MSSTPAAPRPKILLIDDDDMVVGPLRSYLVSQGCEVDLACDRTAAELVMSLYQYDTVMVDPYMTGAAHTDRLALLDSVRAMQPAAAIVVVTAYATDAVAESLSRRCRATLLIKPRPIAELGNMVLGPARIASSVSLPGGSGRDLSLLHPPSRTEGSAE